MKLSRIIAVLGIALFSGAAIAGLTPYVGVEHQVHTINLRGFNLASFSQSVPAPYGYLGIRDDNLGLEVGGYTLRKHMGPFRSRINHVHASAVGFLPFAYREFTLVGSLGLANLMHHHYSAKQSLKVNTFSPRAMAGFQFKIHEAIGMRFSYICDNLLALSVKESPYKVKSNFSLSSGLFLEF